VELFTNLHVSTDQQVAKGLEVLPGALTRDRKESPGPPKSQDCTSFLAAWWPRGGWRTFSYGPLLRGIQHSNLQPPTSSSKRHTFTAYTMSSGTKPSKPRSSDGAANRRRIPSKHASIPIGTGMIAHESYIYAILTNPSSPEIESTSAQP